MSLSKDDRATKQRLLRQLQDAALLRKEQRDNEVISHN
jgi:hypothetical protein